MKTTKGLLSVVRQDAMESPTVVIRAMDDVSGQCVVEIDVEMTEYAEVITGSTNRPCEVHFDDSQIIGKTCERKPITVELPSTSCIPGRDSTDTIRMHYAEAIRKYETDGWRVLWASFNRRGARQPINSSMERWHLTFERWLESDGSPILNPDGRESLSRVVEEDILGWLPEESLLKAWECNILFSGVDTREQVIEIIRGWRSNLGLDPEE